MKFYHGTSYDNWNQIQDEGILYGKTYDSQGNLTNYRCTHLAFNAEVAENYGDVLLEVEYDPTINPFKNTYSYSNGYMIRVEEAIPFENVTYLYDINEKKREREIERQKQHENNKPEE